MDHPHYRPSLGPSDFPSMYTLQITWLTNDLRQMPTWSKLSLPDYRHSTPIYIMCRGSRLAAVVGRTLKFQRWQWKSGVYHLLSICHVYIEVRLHFSASECLSPYSLKLFYMFSNSNTTHSNYVSVAHFCCRNEWKHTRQSKVLSSEPTPKHYEGTEKADGSPLRPALARTKRTLTFNHRRVQYWKTAMKIIEKFPKGSERSMRLASVRV
jgi:hypothetical protein